MSEFLVEAVDTSGRAVVLKIEADGPTEAVRSLRDKGYTSVELRADDTLMGGSGLRDPKDQKTLDEMSPEDRIATASAMSLFWPFVKMFLVKAWWAYAIGIAAVIAKVVFTSELGWVGWGLIALMAMPFGLAAFASKHGPHVDHLAYHQALYEGRWEDALELVDGLSDSLGALEAAVMKAKILAVNDELEQALALVKPLGGPVSDVAYYPQLATIYDAARDFEAEERVLRMALEAQPDNPTILMDLARIRLEHHRDTTTAAELLARADRTALVREMKFFGELLDGMMALELGNHAEARDLIEGVTAELEGRGHRPIFQGLIDLTHMYVALAYAGLGDLETARQHYEAGRPCMVTHKRDYLLERVEAALTT